MDLIILGVDGVDPEYLEKAVKKRDMANWQRLKQESFYCDLPSTIPSITIPAWQCMFSGYDPGRFNTFHMSPFDYEEMEQVLQDSSNFRGEFFWDRANVKSSLHYVPGTYPVYPINGWMRSGFPSAGKEFYPEELEEEAGEIEGEGDEWEFNLARLMMEKDADVFVSVVRMTDRESHRSDTVSEILDIYQRTDELLGDVMDKAEDEDANLIVTSDHGFMHADKKFNVAGFLNRLDLLEFKEGEAEQSSSIYRLLEPLLATPLKTPLRKAHTFYKNLTGRRLDDAEDDVLSIIEPSSKVLPSWKPVGREFGVKVNTDDMPHGAVSEGKKEEFIKRVEEELAEIKHNGKQVVQDIWRGEELYEECSRRPDLVFRTTEEFIPSIVSSQREFVYTSSFTHNVEGIFFAKGPDIDTEADADMSIADVAPLIYTLLDSEIPAGLKGKVPKPLLDSKEAEYMSDEVEDLEI